MAALDVQQPVILDVLVYIRRVNVHWHDDAGPLLGARVKLLIPRHAVRRLGAGDSKVARDEKKANNTVVHGASRISHAVSRFVFPISLVCSALMALLINWSPHDITVECKGKDGAVRQAKMIK